MFDFGKKSPSCSDLEAPESPSNLTAVSFGPQNTVVASSWDGSACVWGFQGNSLQGKAKKSFPGPLMDICWTGNFVTAACADKNAWLWDPVANQTKQIGSHTAPVRKILAVPENSGLVASGSWDCSVKFWDMRKQGEAFSCPTNERVYAMDCKSFVLAVGVAQKGLLVYDTRKLNSPVKTWESPLRLQTRCVSVFKELDGVCVGSIEGRIAVIYFQNQSASFNFKAHRERESGLQGSSEKASVVNAIVFHPKVKTFVSCGSDGQIFVWDKAAKQKCKSFPRVADSIVDAEFDAEGKCLLYATSYDYGQGSSAKSNQPGKVYIKKISPEDVKKK